MTHSSVFVRSLIIVLCMAVFAMRMGGAHLHLCLDGGAPLATVQVADTETAQGGLHKPHHDLDISLVGEGFAKKNLDGAFDLPVLLAAVLVLFIVQDVGRPLIRRARAFAIPSNPFVLLPPSRGPPR